MKSHIILPGALFEDNVSRELHTKVRDDPSEEGATITERHFTPISENHLVEGLYCDCCPEIIVVGGEGSEKYGVLHQSDLLRIAIPSYLPENLG